MPRKDDFEPAAIAALLRRAFAGPDCRFARTEAGVSTQVYRVWHGDDIFYLRLAESAEASLHPEMQIHTWLHERGVKAPQVVYFEPFDPVIERSAMVTTEIRGDHIGNLLIDSATAAILREAGRDLAVINSLPVAGYGWIRRDRPDAGRLEAEHASLHAFIFEHLEADIAVIGTGGFDTVETGTLRDLILDTIPRIPGEQAWLAHGDFDVSHIFQEHGRYTGIIDFGEIRGATRLYDLGHFRLHDGERLNQAMLRELLQGYQEITPLPPDAERQIDMTALMIGVRTLARVIPRPGDGKYQRHLTQAIRTLVSDLA